MLQHSGETSSRPHRQPLTGWAFSNSYAALPERFFTRLDPVRVAEPRLIKLNEALAQELSLECGALDSSELASIFSGNAIPPGAEPIAMVYAGHQFGQFVARLGDGRAILLGEVIDRRGRRCDIQLKGTGRTPYSRSGDGRAALGPVLREYLVSEAMHALGVATTRALAAVTTGEEVLRDARLPGAIVTRVAASHVRVGTFEYFAARADHEAVRVLADYSIDRHYPELKAADRPYLELLRAVARRQAALVASWMHVGFIHGVMNTDNTAISGETIDFGPCAFMDAYDPSTVFSSIDAMGRYSFANQQPAAQWNLARFAETLLPLIDADLDRAVETAGEVVSAFSPDLEERWLAGMRRKLGLFTSEPGDIDLARAWLDLMHRNQCDYTLTFRRLCDAAEREEAGAQAAHAADAEDARLRASFFTRDDYAAWARAWRSRTAREPRSSRERALSMRRANPALIPRNHRIERVITAAVELGDFGPFEEMLEALARPYERRERFEAYAAPPAPAERVLQTFCGT
ncbi:MAG TPA: YdiU family protein [Steroidobacteraceae bacterium]|nr:YdiU family protein [Steroidobacteraceae bacterium]